MVNERITENVVRNYLHNDELFKNKKVIIEEQSSNNIKINKLLSNASKSGNRKGYPEFIIQYNENSNLVIVIECKAEITRHESQDRNKYKNFAVDGILLYASFLSKEYDVIAIAVSGDEANKRISHFLQLKGTQEAHHIFNDDSFFSLTDYLNGYKTDERKFNQDFQELLKYSKALNDKLHSLKVKESERSLLISGTLIALTDQAFINSYKYETPPSLASLLVNKINEKLSSVQTEHIKDIKSSYSFITTHTILSKQANKLKEIIDEIDAKINDFIKNYKYFDTLGQFYIEFLRYANNDKGLGIVLTPPHITELFCEIANVNKDSIVLDTCTGTGGFLISAMQKMIRDAGGDKEKEKQIKDKQIVGIELQHDIYSLLCSNMYMHGDGRSNLMKGSCFDNSIKKQVAKFKPNVGFLNPPYKTNKDDVEELEFVLNNLEQLEKGSYCVAIIPMSCILATSGIRKVLKEKLLKYHTLEAVFSMPDELFINSNVGVITAVCVFRAKETHHSNYKSFFGYWKNDGFYKKKTSGRSDYDKTWNFIKKKWITSYKNKDEIAGLCIKESVNSSSEWCAEAYMDTDYSVLGNGIFESEILKYSTYIFANRKVDKVCVDSIFQSKLNLKSYGFQPYPIGDIFNIQKGQDQAKYSDIKNIPLVSATRDNNGISGYVDEANKVFNMGCITVASNGASTGEAFYQNESFCATGDVNVLDPIISLNIYSALFICALIRLEKYRFNYGRKWGKARMELSIIYLPSKQNSKGEYEPNWQFMEDYIKSLPYSSNL